MSAEVSREGVWHGMAAFAVSTMGRGDDCSPRAGLGDLQQSVEPVASMRPDMPDGAVATQQPQYLHCRGRDPSLSRKGSMVSLSDDELAAIAARAKLTVV